MIMAIPNNEEWRDLFEVYRNLPELWKVRSDEYKNKSKKTKGWETLLSEYKRIDADATLDKLKSKINSIRTSYRRELKKVNDSIRSGAGEDDVYAPSIWYYSYLDFLKDQEIQMPGVSTIDLEDDTELPVLTHRSKINRLHYSQKDQFLKKAVEQIENSQKQPKDDAATFSEYWACLFRKLSDTQQLYARKAIEEILLLGQLNQLTLNTVSTTSAPSSNASSRASTPYSYATPSPPVHMNQQRQFHIVQLPALTPTPKQLPAMQHQQYTESTQEYKNINDLLNDTQFSYLSED